MDPVPVWLIAVLALLSGLVLLHTFLLLGLVQITHRVHEDGGVGALGKPAPHVVATSVDGRAVDTRALAGSRWAALFVSTDCRSCSVTLEELAAVSKRVRERIVVFCRGDEEACRALAEHHDFPVIVDAEAEARGRFGVTSVPTAVIVGEDGRIESEGQPQRSDFEALEPSANQSGAN